MISCKRATELISRSMEERLSLKEELELKLHLFICDFCDKFQRQVQLLKGALSRPLGQSTGESDGDEISRECAESKERVKKRLASK